MRSVDWRVSTGGLTPAGRIWSTQGDLGTRAMNVTINAKQLRAALPEVVSRVRRGARYTVIYRSRPAFRIVPLDESTNPPVSLEDDPLFEAKAVGRSKDRRRAEDHDSLLYGR